MNSPKDAGFLFIHAYVFLQIQRESFSIFVGLISDSRLFEWLVLPIYNRYPISDLFLYPSHTALSLLYSAISCEGCERRLYIRTFGSSSKNEYDLDFHNKKFIFVHPAIGTKHFKGPFLWKERAYLSIRLWIVVSRFCSDR